MGQWGSGAVPATPRRHMLELQPAALPGFQASAGSKYQRSLRPHPVQPPGHPQEPRPLQSSMKSKRCCCCKPLALGGLSLEQRTKPSRGLRLQQGGRAASAQLCPANGLWLNLLLRAHSAAPALMPAFLKLRANTRPPKLSWNGVAFTEHSPPTSVWEEAAPWPVPLRSGHHPERVCLCHGSGKPLWGGPL